MATRYKLTAKNERLSRGTELVIGMPAIAPGTVLSTIEIQLIDENGEFVPGIQPVTLPVSAAADFVAQPVGAILVLTEPPF